MNVTGPISSLPGSAHKTPDGTMCDDHPEVRAVKRMQGETDSFGSEQHDLCQACVDKWHKHEDESRTGCCDWCKALATDLRPKRDFEEGSAGPVYNVCGACVRKEGESLQQELDENDDDHRYIDLDD